MPGHVVGRIVELLNDRGVALSNATVLVAGVAYKPDVSDTRESPAIDILDELAEWGGDVSYHDPLVPRLDVVGETYESVPLTTERLQAADCVVIVTDHSAFDVDEMVEHAPLLFDTRNATGEYEAEHVVRL